MRTTRIIAFSVPPGLERDIQRHANAEHRTVSEYLREAVRQYMALREFEQTRKTVSKRLKSKGVKRADVEAVLSDIRKRA